MVCLKCYVTIDREFRSSVTYLLGTSYKISIVVQAKGMMHHFVNSLHYIFSGIIVAMFA